MNFARRFLFAWRYAASAPPDGDLREELTAIHAGLVALNQKVDQLGDILNRVQRSEDAIAVLVRNDLAAHREGHT